MSILSDEQIGSDDGKKYMVIVQKKGGPTISYHKSKKAARKHWRFVVAYANDAICTVQVVKIIDSIQLEACTDVWFLHGATKG